MTHLTGIYFSSESTDFNENIQVLLGQLTDKQRIISLLFFGATNDEYYEKELKIILEKVNISFENNSPLVSYIAQSLPEPQKMAVEVHYLPESINSHSLLFKQSDHVWYAVFEWESSRVLIIEGVRGNSQNDPINRQGNEIFKKIETILLAEGMQINEIVRQWNYIGKITDVQNGIQNYQAFNESRSCFYEKTNWENRGYPAATGIGTDTSWLVVSLIAVSVPPEMQIVPLNNPLQIAAHAYSQSVLNGEQNSRKKTPKFERGKIIQNRHGAICFVSGTAAIRSEESLNKPDAGLQTQQTIDNINYLISGENLKWHNLSTDTRLKMAGVRVYIKNMNDLEQVKAKIEQSWANIPAIYLQADICRSELLVEIEGIALRKPQNHKT